MSELPAGAAAETARPSAIFEQRLFELSPVGALPTTVAIFVLLFGSFEVLAVATHYPLADQLSFSPREGAWPAAILSLLLAVALGMQRYVRLKDIQDAPLLSRLIHCDTLPMAVDSPPSHGRLRRATLVGAAAGLAISFVAVPSYVLSNHVPVFLWFAGVMTLLGAMFSRGMTMTRIAARNFAERIDHDLKIDLLRVDELSIIGRSSARTALIWLSVAAVISLFFVSGHAPGPAIVTVVLSAGMAFWIFFRSLERVHRRIKDAKCAELDRLRQAIAEERAQAVRDHAAATRLHGLLAYETRIEHVHEWPFDQLTLLRVSSYVLIPASPALGQLAMRYFSDHVMR